MKGKIGIIIGVIVLALIAFGIGNYNGLVEKEEAVETAESNIDTALQRRLDLIPNLVNTVKGYASHEEQIINDITTARENLLKANTTDEKMTANNELDKALNALMVVVENYPDLKANTNFINLQDELAGTENRIATARRDYNEVVKTYNTSIKKFPGSIVAGMFGFEKKPYFEASKDADTVPEVNFE